MTAKLYIIQGFIGAGKTTFSEKLAAETGAVHLNPDQYCEDHFTPEELENNWDDCFSEAVTACWEIASEHLLKGEDVIFDMGFWTKESRDYARQKTKETEAELVHYYLDTPDDVLLERLKARDGGVSQDNVRNFESLKSHFEPPSGEEPHILVAP